MVRVDIRNKDTFRTLPRREDHMKLRSCQRMNGPNKWTSGVFMAQAPG
jgi:hypothetical protein